MKATLERAFDLRSGSGALRVRQHLATAHLLTSRGDWWTGFGPGRWQEALRTEAPTVAANRIAHSDFLRTLADGGLVALFAIVSMLVLAVRAAWRTRYQAPESVVFVAVIAVADAPLFRTDSLVVAAMVLAALTRSHHGPPAPRERSGMP